MALAHSSLIGLELGSARPGRTSARGFEWLGFWEPAVERARDYLFGSYLATRGWCSSSVASEVYWTAAALNCCGGTLAFYLERAEDPNVSPQNRDLARRAIHQCARLLRNAEDKLAIDVPITPTKGIERSMPRLAHGDRFDARLGFTE
ncbi:MAG: hypothetical protein QM784_04605 [Polyangiaceae bacterium]